MNTNPHFDQFQTVTKAKSFLDKIQTFHIEGTQNESGHQQNINAIDDQKCDWILNLWIGANIDSGKLSDILKKTLKSRLEKEYSADIHRLALKLASIIAEKKEIVPLSYGIWPLPEDLAMLTKHMKNDDSEEHTELWLEKVAGMLDDPKADDEKWLILRKVLLHLLKKISDTETASRIFHNVFDEMRAKVWWKMHFKQHLREEFTYDKFVDELWTKLYGGSGGENPMLESYNERYLWISQGIEPKDDISEVPKVVSNLSLTRKQSKLIPNFHQQIHINLPKDIGLLSNVVYKDDIFKLHIVLKYLQQKYFTREEMTKSIKFPFSKENLDVAYQVLKNNNQPQHYKQCGKL